LRTCVFAAYRVRLAVLCRSSGGGRTTVGELDGTGGALAFGVGKDGSRHQQRVTKISPRNIGGHRRPLATAR